MRKRKLEIVVISDVHLGTSGANAEDLLSYLKRIDPKILIINGDFIDGWNFKKRFFPQAHFEVIRRIIKMMNKGTMVYYITGNHDEFLRKYDGLIFGHFQIVDQLVLNVNGKKAWFFHGDIFDTSIQGKMKYLAKLGGKAYDFLIWTNRMVNQVLMLMGRERMSFSKRVKQSVKLAVKWVNDFEQIASDIAIENGYSYICCGHIHTPGIKIYNNEHGQVTYLNSGDWIENNSSLELKDGKWSIASHWKFKEEKKAAHEKIMDREISMLLSEDYD